MRFQQISGEQEDRNQNGEQEKPKRKANGTTVHIRPSSPISKPLHALIYKGSSANTLFAIARPSIKKTSRNKTPIISGFLYCNRPSTGCLRTPNSAKQRTPQ